MRFHALQIKRVYAVADAGDGLRVLVDRLWPRGLTKEKARIDLWLKEIAPSNDLRARFHGNPALWDEFNAAYARELAAEPARSAAEALLGRLRERDVTLLYAARDEERNNAAALRDYLLGQSSLRALTDG
ncbi:MAG: DUF488 domain-containing protein [Rhodomicrobium sp.]